MITCLFGIVLIGCGSSGGDGNSDDDGGGGGGGGGGDPETPATAGEIEIQLGGSLQNPCFSPDGKSIAFTNWKDGYNKGKADVGVVALTGGQPTIVSESGAQSVNLPGSCWSRMTDRITYSSDIGDHDEVYLVAPDGTKIDQVTTRDAMAWEPSLSPDGAWVVFESHALSGNDNGQIWKARVDTGEATPLTDGTFDDRQPNWSPAGDRIVFQSTRDGNVDLYTIAVDGSELRRITTTSFEDTDVSWSPDGKFLVYSTDEGSLPHSAVFVISSDGGTPTRVTQGQDYSGAPSWSPDGKWIAFETTPGDPDTSPGSTIHLVAAP